MNKITAKAILGDLLEAYEQCEHGDYFYDNGDSVCNAVECVLREQPRWISVAERLPKRGETVLCYMNFERDGSDLTWKNTITENRYDGVLVGSNPKKHVWEWQGDFVTHWMPLPEPPEVEV